MRRAPPDGAMDRCISDDGVGVRAPATRARALPVVPLLVLPGRTGCNADVSGVRPSPLLGVNLACKDRNAVNDADEDDTGAVVGGGAAAAGVGVARV